MTETYISDCEIKIHAGLQVSVTLMWQIKWFKICIFGVKPDVSPALILVALGSFIPGAGFC